MPSALRISLKCTIILVNHTFVFLWLKPSTYITNPLAMLLLCQVCCSRRGLVSSLLWNHFLISVFVSVLHGSMRSLSYLCVMVSDNLKRIRQNRWSLWIIRNVSSICFSSLCELLIWTTGQIFGYEGIVKISNCRQKKKSQALTHELKQLIH